jgi:hypothetical protein
MARWQAIVRVGELEIYDVSNSSMGERTYGYARRK